MILERVIQILADQLGIEENKITSDTDIMADLSADSLDVVEMIMKIEEDFDVTITDEAVHEFRTVGDVVAFLEEKL